ncbi:Oxaloacetate decarboxylase beta chain [Mannheimia haemolytica]|uniref:oxaloacetate decarboxylase (Na(+) extruding) n=1 Tax=Mannheimia haemolytica TaxID=75985 RepID=A0A378MYC6_MANHA|nr:Oxaloacetate decarboxylase beta chain [Mannheimia haemolytica]
MLMLGAAAQFGIFATVLGALGLNWLGIIDFTLHKPLRLDYRRGRWPDRDLSCQQTCPELLGAIAVAAYSYMALVPLIQPPIMKALTTSKNVKSEWFSSVM